MRALTCGKPLSLSHLPSDQVVRVAGLNEAQLAICLDPLPPGAPVVVHYEAPRSSRRPLDIVADVLDRLESIALDLFPAWLPSASTIGSSSDFDRRVIRQLAHRRAEDSKHFGPFLSDMAEAALRGCAPAQQFGTDVRARGLARIIEDSYGGEGIGVVLLIAPTGGSSDDEQRRIANAYEWLASRGSVGVWLTPGALPAVDRFPTWRLSVPGFVDALSALPPLVVPPIDYPALAGRPHPASAAEETLERYLARCQWARGRVWNQLHASYSLAPPIRVDLMWPDERCIVEIDGPDHRGILKYADDRRRDNGLVLDGFAVLRFTNEEISDDPHRVLAVIERLLVTKRHDEGTPP